MQDSRSKVDAAGAFVATMTPTEPQYLMVDGVKCETEKVKDATRRVVHSIMRINLYRETTTVVDADPLACLRDVYKLLTGETPIA